MASDAQKILAASRFEESAIHLRDIPSTDMPVIAKIVKGQFLSLGVPSLSNPNLQSTALFIDAGRCFQIVAQPIKIKDGKKSTNTGSRILIPESYRGFFEILSEDGKSTKSLDNVLELSRRKNVDVLVRDTFVVRTSNTSSTLHAGEILTPLTDNGKTLQCRTSKNQLINLPLDCKAKFSPIAANAESISGVHSVRNLLQKRMPMKVRLVHGVPPKGLKSGFVPEFRLLGCIEIKNNIFALPLQKDIELISIPLNTKLKLVMAKNMEQLENFTEYQRLIEKTNRLLREHLTSHLQIVDYKVGGKDWKKDGVNLRENYFNGHVLQNTAQMNAAAAREVTSFSQSKVAAAEYDEIDQIYDYIRGMGSLPKNLNMETCEVSIEPTIHVEHKTQSYNKFQNCQTNDKINSNNRSKKLAIGSMRSSKCDQLLNSSQWIRHELMEQPIPPSLKTIPTKLKQTARRPALIIGKTNISTNGQRVSLSHKDSTRLSPQSPLFHIRYKSLSSLHLASDSTSNVQQNVRTTRTVASKSGSSGSHHIHNTYSLKNLQVHEKGFELKKSSSMGTTSNFRCSTLDSSSKSSYNIKDKSLSVNLGNILEGFFKKTHKRNYVSTNNTK